MGCFIKIISIYYNIKIILKIEFFSLLNLEHVQLIYAHVQDQFNKHVLDLKKKWKNTKKMMKNLKKMK